MRMNASILGLATAALLGAAACGGDDRTAENAALQNDLSLAAQQQTRLDSVSALEAGAATAPASNVNTRASSVRRSTTTSSAPRRPSSTRRTSSSGTVGSTAGTSSGTVTT